MRRVELKVRHKKTTRDGSHYFRIFGPFTSMQQKQLARFYGVSVSQQTRDSKGLPDDRARYDWIEIGREILVDDSIKKTEEHILNTVKEQLGL